MKIVLIGDGKIELQESEKLEIKEGYSIVKVDACGVCGSDIPRIFLNKAYHYPIIIGHEFSGHVIESLNKDLINKRCTIFPILGCMECDHCKNEEWANCTHYDYYGSRRDGGMQDYLLVKDTNIIPIPDNVTTLEAAMTEPCAVTLHAIKKAEIKKDEKVLIYGAGTIGSLASMWVKSFGATPYLVDIDKRKLDFMESLGYNRWNNEEVDVVIEASGAPISTINAINNVKTFGRIIFLGNAFSDCNIDTVTYSKILRKQLTIKGSWNSDFAYFNDDWNDSIEAISLKKIDPSKLITHKYNINHAQDMIDMLKERKEFTSKVMVIMNEE